MNTERELTVDELDAVSGGANVCKTDPLYCIPIPIGPGEGGGGGGGTTTDPIGVWNQLLHNYGYA
jgi:hypothetical protein